MTVTEKIAMDLGISVKGRGENIMKNNQLLKLESFGQKSPTGIMAAPRSVWREIRKKPTGSCIICLRPASIGGHLEKAAGKSGGAR